jgi:hypothetical protein
VLRFTRTMDIRRDGTTPTDTSGTIRRTCRSPIRVVLALLLVGAAAAGCGGDDDASTQDSTAATTPVTTPELVATTGEAVLTISGRLTDTKPLAVDLAGLEELETVTVEVYEPYEKADLTFEGVRLLTILEAAGVDPDATHLRLVALDDYVVELELKDIDDGAIVATRAGDGTPLAIEAGGPIRLVFTAGSTVGEVPNNWIWSIATMELS